MTPLGGLAHAPLVPVPAYDSIRYHAQAAARRLLDAGLWTGVEGDFAEEFSRSWDGGRLAVCDSTGSELGVASVMLVEFPATGGTNGRPHVIMDARPDTARVEAFLATLRRDGDGRSRPAA